MKTTVLIPFVGVILLLVFISNGDGLRKNGICPWQIYKNSSTCLRTNFLCSNGECIDRSSYCNGVSDCLDKSDENCGGYTPYNEKKCPTTAARCPDSSKCIPKEWFCDGIQDCRDGKDEVSCAEDSKCDEHCAKRKALQWLKSQKRIQSGTEMWGSLIDKFAVAHYLAADTTLGKDVRKEMAYEVSIQFLAKLSNKKIANIPSSDLASYVNALLATCLDPRKFHGHDIVKELRSRVNSQNHTNPYAVLALCNAGDTVTDEDKRKLINVFWAKRRTFWTDIQAVTVMALGCAKKQQGNNVDSNTLLELALELKKHQYRNGTVENLQTTALVLQALFSVESDSDVENFDEERALQQLLAAQLPDGSFGSFMNTYYVLPVLGCTSLGTIRSEHCEISRREETSAVMDLTNRSGPKIRVQYSLRIGNDIDLERYLVLTVPANTSFYGVMEMAAELDSRYRIQYVMKSRKPYVTALSGLQNDPEKGKFWFLYNVVNGKPEPSQESPVDVIPKNNEHFLMWYRSDSWID